MTRTVALAAAAMLFVPDEAASQSVRDSAGIRILTYAASARAKAVWRLDSKPMLQIGGADGTGPTEFGHIWDVARTPRGGVVVSDEPLQELRVFDANGRFMNRIGRKGPGPGEFSQIKSVSVHGDTIYAVDTRRGTAAFLFDGTLVRHPALPSTSPYHPIEVFGVFADGSVMMTGAGGETPEEMQRAGMRIETRGLLRISGDGRSAKVLKVVPTYQHFRAENERGGDVAALAPYFSGSVVGEWFCMGRPVRYEVQCLDTDGRVRQIIRRDLPVQPVPAAAREAVIASRKKPGPASAGHAAPSAQELELLAMRTPFSESLPAYDWMLAGQDGELWVSDFLLPQYTKAYWEPLPASAMRRYNVFARDGTWIAAIDIPARFLVKKAGRDYVLGVTRDEDNVEGVAMYRVIR